MLAATVSAAPGCRSRSERSKVECEWQSTRPAMAYAPESVSASSCGVKVIVASATHSSVLEARTWYVVMADGSVGPSWLWVLSNPILEAVVESRHLLSDEINTESFRLSPPRPRRAPRHVP